MKPINYNNPVIAGYLLLGVIFTLIGFSKGFVFFLLGALFIIYGIKENNKII
ncbi:MULTISPECIES: hypothetical protein [Solibacillus]|uniref:DUF2273 domain-containing protein n=1 Tax=Solibacillus merdavium TaxID=2762218 RepID=A0ABR8XMD8_9BACL|nr:hypothetical protein [Solibacillus merdavium]MBD8033108.1 hypothetical protein [Solibacillus merdavium]